MDLSLVNDVFSTIGTTIVLTQGLIGVIAGALFTLLGGSRERKAQRTARLEDQKREDEQRRYDEHRDSYVDFWRDMKRKESLVARAHTRVTSRTETGWKTTYAVENDPEEFDTELAREYIDRAVQIDLADRLADLELFAPRDTSSLAAKQVERLRIAASRFLEIANELHYGESRQMHHITEYMEHAPELRDRIRRDLSIDKSPASAELKSLDP